MQIRLSNIIDCQYSLLQRTSSGRLIKPPLAWWRGQRIMTDGHHNLTAIEPGGEEHTSLSIGLYDFDRKLPKVCRLVGFF
jgi:hypothetical protein